jgi:hypothetical protein
VKERVNLSSTKTLTEFYFIENEPQTLKYVYSQAIKILDYEYERVIVSLDDVIKTCENLNVEEQQKLKKLLQNLKIFSMDN